MLTTEIKSNNISATPEKSDNEQRSLGIAKILIIDDDPLSLKALEQILKSDEYALTCVRNGAEAREKIRSGDFAVILSDQRLPDASGIELLKESTAYQPNAVRILITAFGDLETAIEAINIGQASQFILKPWDNTALRQTVYESVEKYRLVIKNHELTQLISKQNRTLARINSQLKRELSLGSKIQEVMLIEESPVNHPNLEVASVTIPSKDIDGDFFGFYPIDNSTFDLAVGDVMGKGLPAALVGIAVKTQLSQFVQPAIRLITHDKIRFWKRQFLSPSEILGNLNTKISPQLGTLDYFVSLFYSRFDFDQSSLYFVDCGAAKPLHYSNKLKRVTELKGDHFPLGVNAEEHYHTQQVAFETGDCFVFYSDGVSEASAPNGDLFGVQRIADIVTNHAHNSAQNILELIQTATLRFSEKEALDDDMTIVVIKVIEQRTIPQKQVFSMQFSSHISQITAVRKFVETVCSEAPGDRERLTHIMQLVIDEIFSNIVNHGYGGDPTGIVEVIAGLDREGVTFQINDQGIHFNPESVAQPKLTGNQPNGFGWYLIRELVDHIAYVPKNSDEGKNQLTVSHRFIQGGSMEISHHADHDVLVVTLENEHLDSKDAAEFRERIQELCGKENLYQVIFDLHRLKFIDSSGLGAFLSILKMLKTNQGELKLASMGKSVQTMFELVCMHKIFDIFTTTDEALHAFRE